MNFNNLAEAAYTTKTKTERVSILEKELERLHGEIIRIEKRMEEKDFQAPDEAKNVKNII